MLNPVALAILDKRVEEWVAAKGFTQRGITVSSLARQLCTNNKYISVYINHYKKHSFREWINGLRIKEAQIFMLQYPEMNIKLISSKLGFSDKSNFRRHFVDQTRCTPRVWQSQHT